MSENQLDQIEAKIDAILGRIYKQPKHALDELINQDAPFWVVNLSMTNPDCEERVKIQAPTSKEAVLRAISRHVLSDGQMFHTIHIGKPHTEKNEAPDETINAEALKKLAKL